MTIFTESDLFRLDEQYAIEGIPFHARPMRAAMDLLGSSFVMGPSQSPQVSEICRAYAQLIPEVEYTWPGMGTGLVASLDQVRKVTMAVVFGEANLTVFKGLGFSSQQELSAWCRHDPLIASRSEFALADMYDLVYGIDAAQSQCDENSVAFWGLAADQLKLVAESLSQSGSVSSPILQPICLAAELAMKGTLLHLGVTEKDLKNPKLFGHNLKNLSSEMGTLCAHRDDELLQNAVATFPDYVTERYRATSLRRLDVITLALHAQFVAASSIRRLSRVDLAYQVETIGAGQRSKFFH